MLSFHDARKRCLDVDIPMRTSILPLKQAAGLYLAENLYAPQQQPLWDNSAMDGYAVKASDLSTVNTRLRVIEEIPAGVKPQKVVTEGNCSRIMTGAPMPKGADTVVIMENTTFNLVFHWPLQKIQWPKFSRYNIYRCSSIS